MREETWFKWLIISTILHFCLIGALSIPVKKFSRKIDLSSSYSVSLVGDMGGSHGAPPGPAGISEGKNLPAKEPPKPAPAKVKKPAPTRVKPVPVKQEKEVVSLSKKKTPPVKETKKTKETPTKDELDALNRRLREIKKRTDYLDVTSKRQTGSPGKTGAGVGTGSGSGGLPGIGEGSGKPIDLVTQKYWMDVREKIMGAWGFPGAAFKKLEALVTIKIRKDGRIVDINIDKGSDNKVYDESILRALRAVDPLPPIPSSLNLDSIELPFRFVPEGTT
ncbi:MAG: hypothetical protein C0392_07430 [Syntrophus sp. (in: bacteria)]|nr:hypothetical protein [Syntrophus sp. (in: bacteria)]